MKSFLVILCLGIFLVSCAFTSEPRDPETPSPHATGTNISPKNPENTAESAELRDFVASLAPYLEKTAEDVEWSKATYEDFDTLGEMPAYRIQNDTIAYQKLLDLDTSSMFDGWKVGVEFEPKIGSYSEYVNDRFICSLAQNSNDPAGVEKILNETTEEGREKAYQETNFSVTLHCSERPKDALSLVDVSFFGILR